MNQTEHTNQGGAQHDDSFLPGAYVVRAHLDPAQAKGTYRPYVGIVYAESLQQLACLLENSHSASTHFEYSPMQVGDGVLVTLVLESFGESHVGTDQVMVMTPALRPVSIKDDFADQDVGITLAMSQIYRPGPRPWFPVPEHLAPEEGQEHWSLPSSDEEISQKQLLSFERLLQAHASMTPAENTAFTAWESRFVVGDGAYATTDWPGWPAVIARLSN